LWSNLFLDVDREYSSFDLPDRRWMEKPQNKGRIQHLRNVQESPSRIFHSIIVALDRFEPH
jgi:hypothetical protein